MEIWTRDLSTGMEATMAKGLGVALFFAYASVIDNQSGAPVYVPAQ